MTDITKPMSAKEFTLRGLILGALITVVFTAANVAFGLKAGLTFASSIPAAVISMAVLRAFRDSTVQENNIVQTVASAAGTLSALIFVLPGLVMIGWWTGFPFWSSFLVCALGGILGVMYSIPLRRALVTNSDLPYPEGVACAEVLKVGSGGGGAQAVAEGKAGLLTVVVGSIVSAAFYLIVQTKLFAADILGYFRVGERGATGYDLGMSLALFAVGHLVGLWVGMAMLVGLLIAWAGLVPYFTDVAAGGDVQAAALAVWTSKVRFIGAGAIGVAAIWTLLKMGKPVISGLAAAMAAQRVRSEGKGATLPRTEQDIPIGIVALVSVVSLAPIGWLLANFATAGGLGEYTVPLVVGGLVYVVLMGFFVSAVCGYMAGLIGSSNSPLSGVGIIAVLIAALLLVVGIKTQTGPDQAKALIAFALFITAVVFAIASIANNNLQDLKTGQLVDATPWKQQVALVIGVIIGAMVIPPVMGLLNSAYGFAGAPGVDPAVALAAPQAALISSLASGVLSGDLDWGLIGIGAAIGAAVIVVDELLAMAKKGPRLPPLAVGLGVYLPMAVTLMVIIGAVVGWAYEKRMNKRPYGGPGKRLGILLASGLIVGESLMIVAVGAIVWATNNTSPLAVVGEDFARTAVLIGGAAFLVLIVGLYAWLGRLARRSA